MCKCTPIVKTPFCGKGDCKWPTSTKKIEILNKEYDFDSISDIERDIIESLDPRFNPDASQIKTDKNGAFDGMVKVTIEYIEE